MICTLITKLKKCLWNNALRTTQKHLTVIVQASDSHNVYVQMMTGLLWAVYTFSSSEQGEKEQDSRGATKGEKEQDSRGATKTFNSHNVYVQMMRDLLVSVPHWSVSSSS